MAWIKGAQTDLPKDNLTEKLSLAEGYLEEKDAKLWLHDFFKENTQFAVDMLMGIELFPFQTMMIKTMMKSDYFLGILGRGSSKCEKWDNLIWTNDGLKRMIDVEVGDYVQSIKGRNLVLSKTVNAKDQTYRLKTTHGLISEGLDYHRVLRLNPETLDGEWTFSKDVNVGDFLICRKGEGFWPEMGDIFEGFSYTAGKNSNNCRTINPYGASIEEWYYFFGLLIGDGHIHKPGVSVETADEETINFLKDFFNKIGLSTRITQKSYSKSKTVICNSVALISLLKTLGFTFDLAHSKIIPFMLLKCTEKCAVQLLRGLFDTDGHCCIADKKEKNSVCVQVGFSSSSFDLCSQVRNLLLNFDIVSSTRLHFKGGNMKFPNQKEYNCRPAWEIDVSGYSNVLNFRERVGFGLSRKNEKLSLLGNKYSSGEFSDYIPYVGDYLQNKYKKKSFCTSRKDGCKKLTFRKNTSKRWIETCVERDFLLEEDRKKLLSLIDNGVFYSKVLSKEVSENVTVDIQVEKEGCYVSDGIISHNTFSCGIFLALYAMLNQGVHIGVLSASFRQSKGIMKKILDIQKSPKAKLFNDCVTRVSLQNDEWNIEIGQSKITALPLGQGEKLRGFRFQVMVMDELLLMPAKIVNEVVIPFLAVVTNPTERKKVKDAEDILISQGKMTEADRKVWPSNKIIGLSSASYQFEHLYTMYKNYEELILSGKSKNAHYSIFHMSYDAVPDALYDPSLLEKAKSEMSEAQMDREFRSIFSSDSSGFFKISKMMACTFADGEGQSVELFGNKEDKYLLSIDPSWSESDASDYFAMHVMKINEVDENGTCVHPYAIAGGQPKDHIAYFHYLLTNFNIEFIVADFMGGAQFIASCNESELFKSSKIEIKTIDVEVENPEEYGENIKEIRQQYNLTDKRICFLRKPSGTWIRSANELLQRSFDTKDVMFAGGAIDADFTRQIANPSRVEGLKFIREEKGESLSIVDFVENLKDLMTLTKTQCAMIEVSSTPTGHQTFDLPKNLKQQRGSNRARKDLYSALVLANWGKKIFFDMKKMPMETVQSTFTPFFV